jgi:hypothetical protein
VLFFCGHEGEKMSYSLESYLKTWFFHGTLLIPVESEEKEFSVVVC